MKNEAFLYNLPKKNIAENDKNLINTESAEDIAKTFIPNLSEHDGIAPDLQSEIAARANQIEKAAFLAETKKILGEIVKRANEKDAEDHNKNVIAGNLDTPRQVKEPLDDPWSDPGYRGSSRRDT